MASQTIDIRTIAIRVGGVIGIFFLLCMIFTWLGMGRLVYVGLLSGLLVAVLTAAGMIAPMVLGPYESDQVRKWSFGAAPMGIVMLGTLAQMYPASFTPDMFAPTVAIAKLDQAIERYEGCKVHVEGTVSHTSGMSSTWIDEIEHDRVELWLEDDEGRVFAVCVLAEGQEVPAEGSTVSLTGIVKMNVESGGHYLDAPGFEVAGFASGLASAE